MDSVVLFTYGISLIFIITQQVETVVKPILQKRELRLRTVKSFSQARELSRWHLRLEEQQAEEVRARGISFRGIHCRVPGTQATRRGGRDKAGDPYVGAGD